MKIKKKILIFELLLVLSLIFIFPFQVKNVFSTDYGIYSNNDKDQLCGKNVGLNPKSSLILSIVTLCLPGILEKINDWNQIKCQEIVCMYNAVITDKDPSFCSRVKSYEVCTMIIGDIFAIPPMAIFEYYRKAIAQLLANPIGIAYSGAIIADRHIVNTCISKGGCSSTYLSPFVIPLIITDTMALFQRFKDIFKNGFFPPEHKEDFCKQVPAIKKEMEEIVKATSMQDVSSKLKSES